MTARLALAALASRPPEASALIWRGAEIPYEALLSDAQSLREQFAQNGMGRQPVVSIEGDFSPRAVAALLALMDLGAIVVPLALEVEGRERACVSAQVEQRVLVDEASLHMTPTGTIARNRLYDELRSANHGGVVLFSSGSDGPPKVAVHDLTRLTQRYKPGGRASRICAFLAFDHIGGLNTLLYTLVNGGCLAVPDGRSPDEVCRLIAAHGVEVLPTTPTFLNLMLLSDATRRFDLSSLTLITYGTEVMAPATLSRLRAALPNVRVLQTYGLSETGIVATRTPDPDSLWFSIAADDVETRVVDGILRLRAPTTMLGYLDGPSRRMLPDGWFDTGDLVECVGDLFRVIGRSGDIVNVGGMKVHPAQTEAAVLELDGVVDARVTGERNAITGQHLRLEVVLSTGESTSEFRRRVFEQLAGRLQAHELPQRVMISAGQLHGHRHKKLRRAPAAS